MGQQSVGIHRTSASARIAFKRSRKAAGFGLGGSQFLQQFLRVAVVVVLHVRVLDVEVVATRLDLVGRHLPGALRLLPALTVRPPHQSMQPCKCSSRIGRVME